MNSVPPIDTVKSISSHAAATLVASVPSSASQFTNFSAPEAFANCTKFKYAGYFPLFAAWKV